MRAVQLVSLEGPSSLVLTEVPEPVAAPGQLLIDVHAAGVSFPEVLQTRGRYQHKYDVPFVPGAEVAGVVRTASAGAPFRIGDRVAALCGTGGYQEAVAVDPPSVFPLPDEVTFEAGAGLPLNYLTVSYALVRRGRMKAGDTVLVHGAGGGIGTAGVQLARALGATVIAVVSTDVKAELARQAGAHQVVRVDDFLAETNKLTQGRGVDIVLDPVGGDRFTDSLRSLASQGRVLVVGFTAGEIPEVKVNRLLLRNIDVVGVGLEMRGDVNYQELWAFMLPHLRSGALTPVLGSVLPLERAAEAVSMLDERRAAGKVVLRVR